MTPHLRNHPLIPTLLLSAAALALALAPTPAHAQTAPPAPASATLPVVPMADTADPSFAVAAIKPHDPASQRQGFSTAGDHFTIRNETVSSLICFAYAIHPHQIVDAPDWLRADPYDIQGKPDIDGEPSLRQQQSMIKKLLADRFQLKLHIEKRELPVYAIRLAKSGPKLTPAANPNAQPDQEGNGHGTEQDQTYTSASLDDLVLGMNFFLDRPAVNQTGLTGRYDFSITYTWDEAHVTDPNAPPGIFTAVQEQLGLKFEPVRAPVDVLLIDTISRPSPN